MALEFQISQSPFRFGLAEGIEPHQVTPGTLLTAENAVWLKSGKVQKRFGVAAITTSLIGGGNLSAGVRLVTRGSELCLIDGASLYTYSPAQAKFRSAGSVPEVAPTWNTAIDTLQGVASSDVVYATGLLFYAWTTGDPWQANGAGGDLWLQAVDATSGAVVYGPSLIASQAFGARVMYDDVHAKIVIVTRTGAASPYSIKALSFDLATMAFTGGVTTLGTDNATNTFACWDAHLYSGLLVIGYNRTGSIIALESYTPTAGGGFTATTSGTVTDASGCAAISIHGTAGESLYVAYVQGGAAPRASRIAVNNPATMAAVAAATTIDTPTGTGAAAIVGVTRYDNARACVSVSTQETSLQLRLVTYLVSNAAAVLTTIPTYWSAISTSRPFMVGSKAYVMASVFPPNLGINGGHSVLLCADENRLIGLIDLQVAGFGSIGAPPSSASAISSTVMATVAPFQSSVTPTTSNWRQGVRGVRVSTGTSRPVDAFRGMQSSGELFVAGSGCLTSYDGSVTFDYGMATTPVLVTTTSGVGGSIAAGSYLYSAVSEFRSRTGLLYRSPPAIPVTQVTTGATSTNTVSIVNCNLTNKPRAFGTGFLTEAVHRSTVGGSLTQRLSFEPRYNTVYTDYSTSVQTLSDTRADASIDGAGTTLASRPVLYTTGGILDDFAPPSAVTAFQHGGRLWLLAGDQRTWWYSKTFQDDLGVAPGFNPQFRISFEEVQVAGVSMDDKAIFFSASGVKYMLGTGPAPNGQNSDFQTPTKIQSDVGCTNARSVVTTPDGTMFLSERGIYLLTRGLELVWIGRPVKDTLAAFPVITSAVLVPKQNQVRFTCNTSDGASGVTIVYDYAEKQWSTFRHWAAGAYGTAYADACLYNGQWAFVTAAGIVSIESTTSFIDSGNYVPMTLETAWITAPGSQASPSSGPLKFQSVRNFALHGFSNSNHDLTIQIGFDTDASYPQSVTFVAGSATTSVGTLEDCTISVGTRRKCNAIRFRILDTAPTGFAPGTGQGPSLDMMAIEVGMKPGTGNNPATKKG